jgi:hypothetical protein
MARARGAAWTGWLLALVVALGAAAAGCNRVVEEGALVAEEALATDLLEATTVTRLGSTSAIVEHLLGRGFPEKYAAEVASGFPASGASLVRTTRAVPLQRLWGGVSKEIGRWWFSEGLGGAAERLALPPGNPADRFLVAEIPANSEFLVGKAAPLFGQPGGGTQLFALDSQPFAVKERWIKEGGPTLQKLLADSMAMAKSPPSPALSPAKMGFIGVGVGGVGGAGGATLYFRLHPKADPVDEKGSLRPLVRPLPVRPLAPVRQ